MSINYDNKLLDQIYEAAVMPDGWKTVLNDLANRFGSKGGVLFTSSLDNLRWLGSGQTAQDFVDFIAEGRLAQNYRVPRLMRMRYPGFITDLDITTTEEIANSPMYQEFLIPKGYIAVAGTVIQGATDDTLVFSLEGFQSEQAARAAIPFMDGLRPHLARAFMLSSQFHLERARAAATALQMIGVPAAFVSAIGRIRASNRLFEPLIGTSILDTAGGIRLADPEADKRLHAVQESARVGFVQALSLPLRLPEDGKVVVLHALPVMGQARDVFLDGGMILMLTGTGQTSPPGAEVLQALFDLTPAEARLARALANGATLDETAARLDVRVSTIRSQLKSLFAKLGVHRQAELVAMLATLTLPG